MSSLVGWVTRRIAPSTLALLAVGALIVAASAASALAERIPAASPSPSARATPPSSESSQLVLPRPTTTPTPTPLADADPVALGIAPSVGGVIFQATTGIWWYDGDRGMVTRVGRFGRPTLDGAHFITWVEGPAGDTPTLIDAATGSTRVLGPDGALDADWIRDGATAVVTKDTVRIESGSSSFEAVVPGASFVRLAPDLARAIVGTRGSLQVIDVRRGGRVRSHPGPAWPGAWSPDGRYFAYFATDGVGARDGVPLHILDVETDRTVRVGTSLPLASRFDWCSPHTLAFSDGAGRETWSNKVLRLWSPESGIETITDPRHVGLVPSCSVGGTTLYFIIGPQVDYDPLPFFAGAGAGERSIAALDLATRTLRVIEPRPGYAAEGVRPSLDSQLLFTLQRHTAVAVSLTDVHVSLELVTMTADGTQSERDLRVGADVGFGFYGGYIAPESMAWGN